MPLAVGHISNQVERIAFRVAEQPVYRTDDDFDDVNVLPFVEAADVVRLCHLALVEDYVDGTGVVDDVKPVAHIFPFAVDREGLAVADIVDEQRNQLFRELVRTVVVGTVGYDGRHAVGVVESTDEVVAAGFGSGVGTVRVYISWFPGRKPRRMPSDVPKMRP